MRAILFLVFVVFSNYSSAQLYIKPQLNFQFPITKTIRQDHNPYAQVRNDFGQAVIIPGIRLEYHRKNGNGYFFNLTTLPLGYATKFTDYAFLDPFFYVPTTPQFYTAFVSRSSSSDIIAFDLGLLNKLGSWNLSKKFSMDIKIAYGLTLALIRPYYDSSFIRMRAVNSLGKEYEILTTNKPFFDNPNRGKTTLMIPLKLDINIKSRKKNLELLDVGFAYWHGLEKASMYNVAYHNITDNVTYDNVMLSRGSTWQMSVLIPIRVNRIGKLKF